MPQSLQASCRKVLTYGDDTEGDIKTPKKQKFRITWDKPPIYGKRKRQVVIDLTTSPDTAYYLTE